MNICFITPEYYPITGGTGSYVYYLSRMLRRYGNFPLVITKGSEHKGDMAKDEIRVLQINVRDIPLLSPILFFKSSYRSLSKLKAEFTVDIAHANLPLIPSFAIPNGFGKTLISTVHSTWEGEAKALEKEPFSSLNTNEKIVRSFKEILKRFEYKLLKRSDRIIAVSEYTKREILENYDVPAWKINVIYNGVDIWKFKPAKRDEKNLYKRELGFREEDFLILYVGRLYSRKGLPTLIEAIPPVVAKFKNIKFLISGKGLKDEEERLRRYAKQLKVEEKLVYLGYYPDEKLPNLYGAADIFVFPSIYENMPFAMLEALASGLPVITTTVGGIPEVIQNGKNGFLVKPYDSKGLAEKILYLTENPNVASEIGIAGRKTIEVKFNWDNIVKQVLQVYNEALAG